ncbi:MAG: pyrroline-5-carboxylate reductase [Firmicutes bacterium]|nr:pyrroline-5-carboxylate reductase [Bacillota bacterium]
MIGFIGAGNMASALMRGMISGGMSPADLTAFDISQARMDAARELGVQTAGSAAQLARQAGTIVLAVKPKDTKALLEQLSKEVEAMGDILSIVTGWTQAMLAQALPKAAGIVRAMPNTPALVGEGVIAMAANHTIEPARFEALSRALSACGRVAVVPEALFDAVTGICGSGPAYAYLFIEALADAGVRHGLPRDLAYTLASQTMVGAGRMVLETGEHPAALKDAVCSPGGTTIEAVYALEKGGLRAGVMDAVDACVRKVRGLEKG